MVFEGIYACSSLATSEVIIKMVEEYVYPVVAAPTAAKAKHEADFK